MLGEDASQQRVYDVIAKPLVEKAATKEGSDGLLFAYGEPPSPFRTHEEAVVSIAAREPAALNPLLSTYYLRMRAGMTNAGKTHTITGKSGEDAGILPRALRHIFSSLDATFPAPPAWASGALAQKGYAVVVSYIEIYNEVVSDLLAPKADRKDLQIGGM